MFKERILKLTKTLFPKGRAFKIGVGSVKEKVFNALAESESKAYDDAVSILNQILPDNPNFTTYDAGEWERRLGLITNDFVTLDDRKLAIKRKMNHPGTIPARQHYLYIEGQLQAAGFNVSVTENRFPLPATIPSPMGIIEMGVGEMGGEITNVDKYAPIDPDSLLSQTEQMGLSEMGVSEMGGYFSLNGYEVCANHIDPAKDADFFTDTNISEMGDDGEMGEMEMANGIDFNDKLKFTFFVTGLVYPSNALIPFDRKDEFRQLILKLKPANTVAFIFAEYSSDDFNNDFSNDFTNF
jgi:hypothetical protein